MAALISSSERRKLQFELLGMVSSPDDFEAKIGPLRHPCDLDVLLFFHRYRRVLLTSEKLAFYVGHNVKQVGRALEVLIAAGVLTRSQSPSHEARLYVLSAGQQHDWVSSVLSAAATAEGRSKLIKILRQREVHDKTERIHKQGGGGGGGISAKAAGGIQYG